MAKPAKSNIHPERITKMATSKAKASGFNGVPGDYTKDHHVAVRYLKEGKTYKELFAPLRKVHGKLAVKLGGRFLSVTINDGIAEANADGKALAMTPKVFSAKYGKMVTDLGAVAAAFPGVENPPAGYLTYAKFSAKPKAKGRSKAAPKAAPKAPEAPSLDQLVTMLAEDESLKAAFIAKLIG
jgi:hypothetical protein